MCIAHNTFSIIIQASVTGYKAVSKNKVREVCQTISFFHGVHTITQKTWSEFNSNLYFSDCPQGRLILYLDWSGSRYVSTITGWRIHKNFQFCYAL
jgi:hypothetical protein